MRSGRNLTKIAIGTMAMLAIAVPVAYGQAPASSAGAPRFLISSSAAVPGTGAAGGEILREIDDPRNGDRWLLVRDDSHPWGPGLLLLVPGVPVETRQVGPEPPAQAPVIHAGDPVIVEENTAVAVARLEAVALGPAWAGSPFNVRLAAGGKVLRVLAAGPGRAVLQPEVQR